jgi:hypothetical protein
MIIATMSEGGFEFQHPTFPCIILKTRVESRPIKLHMDSIGPLWIDYGQVAFYLSIL